MKRKDTQVASARCALADIRTLSDKELATVSGGGRGRLGYEAMALDVPRDLGSLIELNALVFTSR